MVTGGARPGDGGGVGERFLGGLLAALDRAERHVRPFAHLLLERSRSDGLHASLRAHPPDPARYPPDSPEKYGLPDGTVARSVLPLDDAGLGTSLYRLRPWAFLRTGRLLEEFRRVPFEKGAATPSPSPVPAGTAWSGSRTALPSATR